MGILEVPKSTVGHYRWWSWNEIMGQKQIVLECSWPTSIMDKGETTKRI